MQNFSTIEDWFEPYLVIKTKDRFSSVEANVQVILSVTYDFFKKKIQMGFVKFVSYKIYHQITMSTEILETTEILDNVPPWKSLIKIFYWRA